MPNGDGKKNDEFEFVEIAKKTITSLGPAIKQALLYTLLGIGIGTLLLWWQHHLEIVGYKDSFGVKFLEHLGVGFMVSAIAVFFYEWGAHIKETIDLSRQLNQTIHTIQNRIEPIVTSAAEQALDHSLRAMIGKGVQPMPDNIQKIINDCSTLVRNISELQAPAVWSSDKYVDFISYLIDGVVENSTSLKTVAVTGLGDNRVIVASTAAVMADRILSLQMQAMGKGDSYDVISSLPTWKGAQLDEFHAETRNALSRGVNVRRIFNRLRYVDSEEKLPLDEARRILESHLENTVAWSQGEGKYEVKVMGLAELRNSSSSHLLRERVNTAHFGIFNHRDQNVRYSVEMADLSNMAIAKKKIVIQNDIKLFADAWAVARPLSSEVIAEIISELKNQKEAEALTTCAEIEANRLAERASATTSPTPPPAIAGAEAPDAK